MHTFSKGGMKEALKTYFDFTTFTRYDPKQAGDQNGWETQKISRKRDNLELLKTYQSKSSPRPDSSTEQKENQNQFKFTRTKSKMDKKVCSAFFSLSLSK